MFKLTTKEVVAEIKELKQEGKVSGIFDERGKYLVIDAEEWTAVRNYITTKGRVRKSDIMTECAKLIKIPEQTDDEFMELLQEGEEPRAAK